VMNVDPTRATASGGNDEWEAAGISRG